MGIHWGERPKISRPSSANSRGIHSWFARRASAVINTRKILMAILMAETEKVKRAVAAASCIFSSMLYSA